MLGRADTCGASNKDQSCPRRASRTANCRPRICHNRVVASRRGP